MDNRQRVYGASVRIAEEKPKALEEYLQEGGKRTMSDEPEKEMSCAKGCQKVEVPTEDELRALNAMRDIKEKVRDISKRISQLASRSGGENDEIVRMQHEVERLKEEWKEWDEKRKEAARVRMILLGHEEPD